MFCNNEIHTSRYTVLSFLPKNLLEQFGKMANCYFLVMMLLQLVPLISITYGTPTLALPLVFVIGVSMLKDISEDYKRHKSDNEENLRAARVLSMSTGAFENRPWKAVRVGDVVRVERNEFFPADLVLLTSSERKGIAYVETKNLDGETNLKHKIAQKKIHKMLKEYKLSDTASYSSGTAGGGGDGDLRSFDGSIACEQPNELLYRFEGKFVVEEDETPLDI